MKTTLDIDDKIAARLKREAARHGCTMSEFVETALRKHFRSRSHAGLSLRYRRFVEALRWSTSPTATRSTTR